jgi:colicin import membrane protein
MTAQSPGAYVLSALVHAGAIAVLLCLAVMLQQQTREPAKVIELVAGAGDNWDATEAPALGSPDGSESIKMPNIATPMPKIDDPAPAAPAAPEPAPAPEPEPEPSPVKPAPVTKAPEPPVKAAPVKASPLDNKKTTFMDDVKRISDKREIRRMREYRAKEAREAAARARQQASMSKAEFDKLHAGTGKGGSGATGASGGKISRVNAKGIAEGVVNGSPSNTKGGAGGKALSVEEQNRLDRYFEFLKRAIKKAHVAPPGSGDLSTVVEFIVAADGSLSRVRVVSSSGNAEFDQSVLEAIRRTTSIGMRPDGRTDAVELEFNARED